MMAISIMTMMTTTIISNILTISSNKIYDLHGIQSFNHLKENSFLSHELNCTSLLDYKHTVTKYNSDTSFEGYKVVNRLPEFCLNSQFENFKIQLLYPQVI
jgi:hypothetical protein